MKKILWRGSFSDPSGYGEAARGYVQNLSNVDLSLENKVFFQGGSIELGGFSSFFKEHQRKDGDSFDMVMHHLTPENYFIKPHSDIKFAAMTTFETNSIPAHWLMSLRAMDFVFTFSDFNKETFHNAGVDRPIFVIPHGVDTDFFNPEKEGLLGKQFREKYDFVFGSNFDWSERKNPMALLESYLMGFSRKDNVCLLLKTYCQYDKDIVIRKISEVKNRFYPNGELGDAPDIVVITSMLSSDEMSRFYKDIDCYVSPTRGEGWSLTASESLASGVPVITTNWSAHTEFVTQENGWLIPYDLKNVSEEQYSKFPHYKGHFWADISIPYLVDAMTEAFKNRELTREKGLVARKDMLEKWTWKHACKKLEDVIKEII